MEQGRVIRAWNKSEEDFLPNKVMRRQNWVSGAPKRDAGRRSALHVQNASKVLQVEYTHWWSWWEWIPSIGVGKVNEGPQAGITAANDQVVHGIALSVQSKLFPLLYRLHFFSPTRNSKFALALFCIQTVFAIRVPPGTKRKSNDFMHERSFWQLLFVVGELRSKSIWI